MPQVKIELSDYVSYIKRQVELVFQRNHLNELRYKYLTHELVPGDAVIEGVKIKSLVWGSPGPVETVNDRMFTHSFENALQLDCTITYKTKAGIIAPIDHYYDLTCIGYISIHSSLINFDILDELGLLLRKYDSKIKSNIEKVGFRSLWDDDKRFQGKNAIMFFSDVINKNRTSPFIKLSWHETFDDLARCVADLRYTLTEMTTYRQFITNFLEDKATWNGKSIYRYFPTFYDKQYWLKAGIIIQFLYNYWDKLGSILAAYFAPMLPARQVYFGKIIDMIDAKFYISPNYLWLKNFKDNNFKKLNGKRIKVVHYTNIESEFFQEYTRKNTSKNDLEQLENEKVELANYFIQEYGNILSGFEYTMLLVDEVV